MKRLSRSLWTDPRGWATQAVFWPFGVMLASFALDIFVPLGISIGVLYAAAVALALAGRSRSLPLVVAVVSTVLVVVGWQLSDLPVAIDPQGPLLWSGWNRVLSVLVIWLIYATGRLRQRVLQRDAALLLDSTAEGIYGLDLRGHCTFANKAATSLLGYEQPNDLIGLHMHSLVHHTDEAGVHRPTESCTLYVAYQRGEGVHVREDLLWRRDGTSFPAEVWSYPVEDAGHVIGAVVTFIDSTERTAVEASLRARTHMLESLTRTNISLAAELEPDALLQQVTEAGRELTGAQFGAFFYNELDAQGEKYMRFTLAGMPRERFAGFGMPSPTELFGITFRGEAVIRQADITQDPRYGSGVHGGMPGDHPPVRSYLAVPVLGREGHVLGGLLFGHGDVDVFDATAEDLVIGIAAQASVAIENARLYRDLQETGRQKDEFLAMLAHELRNPLHPLRASAELLDEDVDASVLESVRTVITRQVAHMARLLDDLLDVARISRGKIQLQMEACRVRDVVEQAVESVQPAIVARRHRLLVNQEAGDFWVEGDHARLVQAVSNLLDNAAKYSPDNSTIELSVESEDDGVRLGVRDDGEGIAPEVLRHIWDLFVQGEADLSRSGGGLGLGLHLVHRLIAKHGGRVSALSRGVGQGSRFEIWLPTCEPPPAPQATPKPSVAAPRRILIVDDHPDAVLSLQMLLEHLGHEVQTAADGPGALSVLETFAPEVAILDIGLPGMDGYELAQAVRARPGLSQTKLIALSGYGDAESRERSEAAGFAHHLLKPASIDDLTACLAG